MYSQVLLYIPFLSSFSSNFSVLFWVQPYQKRQFLFTNSKVQFYVSQEGISSCISSFCFILRRNRLGLEQHGPKSGRRHFAQHFQARGHMNMADAILLNTSGTWSHEYGRRHFAQHFQARGHMTIGPRHFAQHFQARGHMTRAAPFWIVRKGLSWDG